MHRASVVAKAAATTGEKYDYDLVIIGCGVGGHGAALHAVEQARRHDVVCAVCCRGGCGCVEGVLLLW